MAARDDAFIVENIHSEKVVLSLSYVDSALRFHAILIQGALIDWKIVFTCILCLLQQFSRESSLIR